MAGRIILLVDDDPVSLELLRVMLCAKGYQVAIAKSGREAIEKAERLRPALILMDIVLPDIDGAHAIEEILKMPHMTNEPSVIFVSGVISQSEQDSPYINVGRKNFPFFAKPLNTKQLIERIEQFLSQIP